MKIGTIASLYHYPVKSMLGESVEACAIETTGIPGDRGHALIDCETGKIASAKRPQLWKNLLKLSARRLATGKIGVTFPDGREVEEGESDFSEVLSSYLGREVRLESQRGEDLTLDRSDPDEVIAAGEEATVSSEEMTLGSHAPRGGFFDFAPIHLVARSSLRYVAEACGQEGLDEIRYRPNIVIEDEENTPFCENDWIGRRLQIGSIELRVCQPTPRCAVPTLEHGGLPRVSAVLKRLTQDNRQPFLEKGSFPSLGVYATVASGGKLRVGDGAELFND